MSLFAYRALRFKSRGKRWAPPTSRSMNTRPKEREGLDNCDTWYYPGIRDLPESTRDLFEKYSSIPPEEVVPHIQEMVRPHTQAPESNKRIHISSPRSRSCTTSHHLIPSNLPGLNSHLFSPSPLPKPQPPADHPPLPPLQRSRAFAIYPYPCIGQHRFLNLSLSRHPLYPKILSRLRGDSQPPSHPAPRPETFLDLGCCLAQDLRKLVADGAPSQHLYGLDIEERFIDLSYDLFRDHATLRSRFVVADLLNPAVDTERVAAEQVEEEEEEEETKSPSPPTSAVVEDGIITPAKSAHPHRRPRPRIPIPPKIPLASLTHTINIVAANSLFHLYSLPQQLHLAKRVVALLAPVPGSLIVGRQVGSLVPGHYTSVDNRTKRYSHDVASFTRFWDQVAREVGGGVRFRVEATLDEQELGVERNRGQSWSEPNIRRLVFGVWRV